MARRASRLTVACGSALALLSASSFAGGSFIVDLTHPIPTFQPMEGDPMKPDMSKPWLDSTAIPSFGQRTVLAIMSDVIGVETGQNSRGEDDAWSNSWYAHVEGLQRGWKLIENGNNLGQLAMAKPGSCMLVAGALKHVRGTGGPARLPR